MNDLSYRPIYAATLSSRLDSFHQLDLRFRVEEPADFEQCHRRVVTTEMPAVGFTDLLGCALVFGDVGHEDLHTDQVVRMGSGSLKSLDDIAGRYIELLREGGAHNRAICLLRRLAGEVDGAARVRNDRVGETLRGRKGLRVANFVGAAYRPLHFASRPSRNAA